MAQGFVNKDQLAIPLPVNQGGTGAETAGGALSNLGLGSLKMDRVAGQTSGSYTTTSTSYVDVDATNLSYTITIPTGYKLWIAANLNVQSTIVASYGLGIHDSVSGGLVGFSQIDTQVVNVRNSNVAFALVDGDGLSHTFRMQWFIGGAGTLTASGSSNNTPVMQFILMKSS